MLFPVTTFGLVCIVWRQTEPASTWRITLSRTSVFVTFSLLWQNMWQSQLKEGRDYSGSQAAGSVHPCREDMASGEGSHWAHWTCCQEAEGNEHLLLSFAFPFYAVLAPAYSVTLIQGSSPYLSWLNMEAPSQRCSDTCFQGASISCQVDNIWPSHTAFSAPLFTSYLFMDMWAFFLPLLNT